MNPRQSSFHAGAGGGCVIQATASTTASNARNVATSAPTTFIGTRVPTLTWSWESLESRDEWPHFRAGIFTRDEDLFGFALGEPLRQDAGVRAIVYSWSSCSFCQKAKDLLEQREVPYREVALDGKKEELQRLYQVFGARTMPLVLLDGERLAGLPALEKALEDEASPSG